jgi:lipopolysaccharide transport system ATP-binding protein
MSSNVVIKVDNLTKEYRLGTTNHGTLYRDLQSWWARLRGKEDPNSILNLHGTPAKPNSSNNDEYFMALNDVSFEVQQGDLVGIIGRNGAGKSTLLKILSQITCPTSGTVKLKGRVASLLEVGTGFHPELTGRENIFLNGAILGMSKAEIRRKLDEIIAFAEVEKFVDTPVKRYSSGMHVRLAFAVAAHLEPEILIVDEVLAVGDVQFQKKCLGKMEEVASEGRTILLVSHNMPTILSLSDKVLLLESGRLIQHGATRQVVASFLDGYSNSLLGQTELSSAEHYGNGLARFRSVQLHPFDTTGKRIPVPETGCDMEFVMKLDACQDLRDISVALTIYDDLGNRLIDVNTLTKGDVVQLSVGKITVIKFFLKNVRLELDTYTAGLWMGIINHLDIDGVRYATSFRVEARREDILYTSPFPGVYSCEFEHEILEE